MKSSRGTQHKPSTLGRVDDGVRRRGAVLLSILEGEPRRALLGVVEPVELLYTVRLGAFLLIIVAIIVKNRER